MFFSDFSDIRLCLAKVVANRSQLGRFGIPFGALTERERDWLTSASYAEFIRYCFSDYNCVFRRRLFMCSDDIVVDLLDPFIFKPDNRFLEGPMGQKVVVYAWEKHGIDLYDIFDNREKYGVPVSLATFSGLGYPANNSEFLNTEFVVKSEYVQVRDVTNADSEVEDQPIQIRSPTYPPPDDQPRCFSPCYNPVSPEPTIMDVEVADSDAGSSQIPALTKADATEDTSLEMLSGICMLTKRVETVEIQSPSSIGGCLVPANWLSRLMRITTTCEEKAIIKLISSASVGKNSQESAMQLDEFCRLRAPEIDIPEEMRGKTLSDVVNTYYRKSRQRENKMREIRARRQVKESRVQEPSYGMYTPEAASRFKKKRVSSKKDLDPD